ncbi:unnamed protein product, partial [Linum tenue]
LSHIPLTLSSLCLRPQPSFFPPQAIKTNRHHLLVPSPISLPSIPLLLRPVASQIPLPPNPGETTETTAGKDADQERRRLRTVSSVRRFLCLSGTEPSDHLTSFYCFAGGIAAI